MSKAFGPTYIVAYRRRRQGRTNYQRRLALLRSRQTRLVVRKTNRNVILQFIRSAPEGDQTLLTVVSSQLSTLFGFPAKRNAASAYLTGLYAGKQAQAKDIRSFILDLGMHTPSKGSILFAAAKGALDAGLSSTYAGSNVPQDKLDSLQGDVRQKFDDTKNKILQGGRNG